MSKDKGQLIMKDNLEDDTAIRIEGVSKAFRLPHNKQSSLKGSLINLVSHGDRTYETQEVLKDISFEIKKGEFFGIVGRNGSGKSTLLKMLAGIYTPTSGKIIVNGSLTPFIELGVGFNPELTGRENIYLNGALLGFNKREVGVMYDDIVKFAELKNFMDQKLKNYSSGMQVRLAFSIAIRAKSDILLLDEVLAVGDMAFQKKCYDYFRQLKKEKRTVVLVSHDAGVLQEYCDRCVLIEKGGILKYGESRSVISTYMDIMSSEESAQKKLERKKLASTHIGSGEILIRSLTVDHDIVDQKQSQIQIVLDAEANQTVHDVIAGVTVLNSSGHPIFASNNIWLEKIIPQIRPHETMKVTWIVPNIFNNGIHTIIPTISLHNGRDIIDQLTSGVIFEVKKAQPNGSYTNPSHKMNIQIGKSNG